MVLSDDLITLGYLEPGGSQARALTRFQRHAKRVYRKTAAGEPVEKTPVYAGPDDGSAQSATLDEIARWLLKGFRLPLGYFKIAPVEAWGWLREDVATAWLALMARIRELGGTIDGPYGDTKRPFLKTIPTGASKFSFHMCGRAVDLNQGLGNSRYYVAREPLGARIAWRIYCKTANQTGAQGEMLEAGRVLCHNFATHQEFPIPAAYYLNLTKEIEKDDNFEHICAQTGWEQATPKSEWWHFQWVPDKQKTFQDECELIGIAEKQLRASGYGDADLDHPPG